MDQVSDFFIFEMCKKIRSYGLYEEKIKKILSDNNYDGRINDFAEIIRGLRDHISDEYMGFGKVPAPIGSFYYAVRLAMLAENLEGFLKTIHHFYITFVPIQTTEIHVSLDSFTLKMNLLNPELDPSGVFRLYMLMSVHRLSSWVIGKKISLQHVGFDFPPTDGFDDYRKAFDCTVEFSENVTSITIPRKYLLLPCIRTESDLVRYIQRRPLDILTIPGDDDSISQRIKQLLYAEQACGNRMPNLENLAKDFHISLQTLRRRLINEGTNYRELKDIVRREVAMEKLATTGLPLADIALLSGFQETNSFFRAFKRWTGISPTEYRSNHSR